MGLGRHEFQSCWVTWNQSLDVPGIKKSEVSGQTWALFSAEPGEVALAEPQFPQI